MIRASSETYGLVLAIESLVLTAVFLHDPPRASEPLGLGLGWAALLSMLVMLVYSVARRSRRLRRRVPLTRWLDFHIFCGLQGALFAFFHCWPVLFVREGPVQWLNPGVLNALALSIVVSSGVFGRYLYAMLPRARRGEQLAAIDAERALREMSSEALPVEVERLCEAGQPRRGSAMGFVELVRTDWRTRRALRRLRAHALPVELRSLAERRVRLARRLEALALAQPWFELWIVIHRPLAMILYVVSFVHVILSLMFRT